MGSWETRRIASAFMPHRDCAGHGFAGDFGLEDLPQPHVDVGKAVSEDGGELVVAVESGLHQYRAGNEGIQLAAQENARVGLGETVLASR